MTGFESWIRVGLELGSTVVLSIRDDIIDELNDNAEDPLDTRDLCRAIADELMKRWPTWRRELLKQEELPLDGNPKDFEICEACRTPKVSRTMRQTPKGRLCTLCMDAYIKGEL